MMPDTRRAGRRDVEAAQLAKARRLLDRLQSNPFYGPRLAASGLDSETLGGLDDWRRLPTVDKAAMLADQEECPPYGTRLGIPASEIRQTHYTSGTSGFGQEAFALTAEDLDGSGRTWSAPFTAMRLAPGDSFVTFYPVTFLAYGRSILEGGRVNGIQVMSLAGVDRSLALELMVRQPPQAIGTRPALLRLLEQALREEGAGPAEAFPNLKGIVTSGISVDQVSAVEDVWRTTVHEVYGSSQAGGIVAATGPEGAAPSGEAGTMWVIESSFLVEPVDPETLEPVAEGEAELLLTCLDRVASPVVRFRTRDRVEVVPPTGDPPLLGIRAGSVGRYDDMCKIRGNNVWPGQLDAALLGHPAVHDYRCEVVVDGRGVDMMCVRVKPVGATLAAGLIEELQQRVKLRTNVTPAMEIDPELPAPALKPRRLVDRRKEQ